MNTLSIYNGFNYTTKQVNKFFKIKIFGFVDGKKVNMLVGVAGLIRAIGVELANKFVARAFRSKGDKQECKLRRGLKVTFYNF